MGSIAGLGGFPQSHLEAYATTLKLPYGRSIEMVDSKPRVAGIRRRVIDSELGS